MVNPSSRILVVNKRPGVRKMAAKTFNLLGYKKVSEATSTDAAWQLLQGANPQFELILADLFDAEAAKETLGFIKKLKSNRKLAGIPVIVTIEISEAGPSPEIIVPARQAGANLFMGLPVTSASLKDAIQSLAPAEAQAA